MHNNKVAQRYAEAIFHVAQAQKAVAEVEADLLALADLLTTSESFYRFIKSPDVPREDKIRIAGKLFDGKGSKLGRDSLLLLIRKGREGELKGVYEAFADLRRQLERTVHATVTSSVALDKKEQAALVKKTEKLTGQKVEARFVVEPSLLGGVRISYENVVVDGSVRGNLDKLRDRLSTDLLVSA